MKTQFTQGWHKKKLTKIELLYARNNNKNSTYVRTSLGRRVGRNLQQQKNKIKKKLDVKFEHKMFVSPLQKVFHVVPSKFLSGIGTFCLIMLSLALFAVSQHLRLYLMIQKMMIYNSKKRYAIQNTCKKKVKEVNIGRYQDWNVL